MAEHQQVEGPRQQLDDDQREAQDRPEKVFFHGPNLESLDHGRNQSRQRAHRAARPSPAGSAFQRALSGTYRRIRLRARRARLHAHRIAQGWKMTGRKIGFTNRTLWDRYGVHEPMWGTVYDRTTIISQGQQGHRPARRPRTAAHRARDLLPAEVAAARDAGPAGAARLHRVDRAFGGDRAVPPPRMESHHCRLHRRQRPARQAGPRHAGARGENFRPGGRPAVPEGRPVQGRGEKGPGHRLERTGQSSACARVSRGYPGEATRIAAARSRRNRQHRHAHRRAPGGAGRALAHGFPRLRRARHGNHVRR